jgi:hypothetical protein
MGGKTTLQELRDLNVRRQRERAEPENTAEEPEDNAQMRNGADAQILAQASTEASARGSGEVLDHPSTEASAGAIERASAQSVASVPCEITGAVREALTLRRIHAGGTKASVDMSPELSLRLKRYCLDHGNPSSRQVMIELLIAFLDREGY